MKKMKKLACLLLAMVMVLSMGLTVSATEQTTNRDYEVYQIFTGDYYEGILSNVKWGKNGTGTENTPVDKSILTELQNLEASLTDTVKLDTILKYANLESAPFRTGTSSNNGKAEFSSIPNGYYLVKDKDDTQNG